MSLKGDGRMIGHELGLRCVVVNSMVPKGYGVNLYTGAAYENHQYHGVFYKLQLLDDKQAVRVDLEQPFNWQVGANQAQVQALCVKVSGGQGCADADWSRDTRGIETWSAHADLKNLPLSISNAALTDTTRLQAVINGQLNLSALNGAPWQGTAGLQLSDASIRYRSGAGREEVLPITLGELQMDATPTAVVTTADIRLSEQTVISLAANLNRSIGTGLDSWPLTGVFALSSSDARLIPVFVNDVDRAAGTLATALQLSGTASSPRVAGTVQLLQGELDFYQTNLALRGLEFNAQIDTDQMQYTAQGNAGEGVLNANGNINWRDSKLAGTLQLKGDRLLVADLPEYHVLASPNLNFDISDRQVTVKGEVVIPEARLQPKEVVGAVQTSADAHFKSDEVIARQNNNWTISSDVSIRLGDEVSFDGLGLQGKLAGAVATRLRTGDVAVGSGEFSVNDGSYEIYGQKLDIKRGRLLYDNTPLGDPGLDIQAERKINDTTVGVNVRGILRAPRLQFYSDPTMSQTQIVSYLLIGKPLDELQSGEATTVRSASNALAIQGGGFLAAQLGRRIGIEQVGVETDTKNQSALVLGKFLSPRLFISYGISLTEAINTVKLRYTLSDHWTIKTEAGEAKGADVEYKIER
jgi:translocation and assembly module TamB